MFAAILLAGILVLKRLLHVAPPTDLKSIPPTFLLLTECVQLAAVVLATILIAAIERRSPLAYGLKGNARVAQMVSGSLTGFAAISALVTVLCFSGFLRFEIGTNHGFETVKYGLLWILVFIAVALSEEMTVRGYLQHSLARALGFGWATLFTSILFGAVHGINPGETYIGLVTAMSFGLLACLSLWYTGSLWWAIGCHVGWDWGQSFVYGVGDSGAQAQGALLAAHPVGSVWLSGGNTGPEGSVFAFPVLFATAALFWVRWRRAAKPV
jgi:hypothetical protein